MKVKVDFIVKDEAGNIQHLYFDAELKSEGSLCTEGGKFIPPTFQGMIVDCMPDIRKEN